DGDAVAHELEDPVDQLGRLAGSGAGLDEQVRVRVGDDAVAGGLIGRLGHGAASGSGSGTGSANQRANRGSWRRRAHSGNRSAEPSPSGVQYQHLTKCSYPGGSGVAGNQPDSMPATTWSRSSPTRAHTASSKS